jgi:myo-inositol-1(or 4)-monophosphatase
MNHMLNIAISAARLAARVILMHLEKIDQLDIKVKGKHKFVTQADKDAEFAILETIKKTYPSHGTLSEESGSQDGDDFTWIIDPIDGTTNFLHGHPHFGISIAVMKNKQIEHGVVFDPIRDELFTASRGEGAQLNNRRIRVSRIQNLDRALLATGFSFPKSEYIDPWLKTFHALLPKTSGIHRSGATSLDLAHVASGRFDGFWEMSLKPWNITAGVILVREAGGLVSDFEGGQDFLRSGNIVAANSVLFNDLLRIVHDRFH